jgi:hypothetical protein
MVRFNPQALTSNGKMKEVVEPNHSIVYAEGGEKIIAVLGDLHGHLTLAYRLLRRWETENNRVIDCILQVGDLGAFPDPSVVDRETRRFAEKDRDELAFMEHYYNGSPEADEILGPQSGSRHRINAPLFFIKGNHEDFNFLEGLQGEKGLPVPIDKNHMILFLRNGGIFEVDLGDGVKISVGALGGIAKDGSSGIDARSPFYTKSEVRKLRAAGRQVDIFLTHDVPFDSYYEETGSRDIRELLLDLEPVYHFCGHYHQPGEKLEVGPGTASFLLNEVNFRKRQVLNPDCFGILRWRDRTVHSFELADYDWIKQFTRDNFREI